MFSVLRSHLGSTKLYIDHHRSTESLLVVELPELRNGGPGVTFHFALPSGSPPFLSIFGYPHFRVLGQGVPRAIKLSTKQQAKFTTACAFVQDLDRPPAPDEEVDLLVKAWYMLHPEFTPHVLAELSLGFVIEAGLFLEEFLAEYPPEWCTFAER